MDEFCDRLIDEIIDEINERYLDELFLQDVNEYFNGECDEA